MARRPRTRSASKWAGRRENKEFKCTVCRRQCFFEEEGSTCLASIGMVCKACRDKIWDSIGVKHD